MRIAEENSFALCCSVIILRCIHDAMLLGFAESLSSSKKFKAGAMLAQAQASASSSSNSEQSSSQSDLQKWKESKIRGDEIRWIHDDDEDIPEAMRDFCRRVDGIREGLNRVTEFGSKNISVRF